MRVFRVDGDPVEVVSMANQIHEGFVNAAAAAIKAHKERVDENLAHTSSLGRRIKQPYLFIGGLP